MVKMYVNLIDDETKQDTKQDTKKDAKDKDYVADKSLVSMRKKLKSEGVFYTPPALAKYLKSVVLEYIDENNIDSVYDKIIAIKPKMFDDTSINTCILVFKKDRGKKDTITFIDTTWEKGELKEEVPISKIKEEGYNLSVNNYVHKPEEEVKINEKALNCVA